MDSTASDPYQPRGLLDTYPQLQLGLPLVFLLIGQLAAASSDKNPGSAFLLSQTLAGLLLIGAAICAKKRKGAAVLLVVSAATLLLGYFLHTRALHPRFSSDHLRSTVDYREPLHLEGILYQEPDRLTDRSRWYFRTESVWHPSGARRAEGKVLVTVRREYREWHYGDRVRFRIRVRPPPEAGNPGEFHYGSYLARRGIHLTGFLASDADVELVKREGWGFWSWTEGLRRRIRRVFEQHLPFDKAAILKALVIGDRGWISDSMQQRFAAAGLAHLLAISGLHVGMLGVVVFVAVRTLGGLSPALLLRWNLLKVATGFSFVAVLFYTVLAGAKIPTVRSAIMIGIYELAVILDREDEILNSLFLAALLIALYWPGAVMEVSFQLSFLAVLFILCGLWKFQHWASLSRDKSVAKNEKRFRIRLRPVVLYLSVPVLAALGTGPMIAYHFGHLSLAGLLSNPVVVPLVGFLVVPLGLAVGVLSLISDSLGLPILWICEPLLSVVQTMVEFFAHLPLSRLPVPNPTWLEIFFIYGFLSAVFLLRRRISWVLFSAVLVLFIVGDAFFWWHQRWGHKNVRVTFLSVGHGDAAVVELTGGKVLLIDAGGMPRGEFDTGKSIVKPFLRSRRISKVDYILLSHGRVDHYGGMETIVEEFQPREYWRSPSKNPTARLLRLEQRANELGLKKVDAHRDPSCRSVEEARICFLYPPKGTVQGESVVARLSFRRVHMIFSGDILARDERNLLRMDGELKSDVMKVPRHGSISSSSESFLAQVKPKLAIVSVGRNNPFGLPNDAVVQRYEAIGAVVLRTDRDGAITVETDGERIRYWTYRSGRKGQVE